MCKEDLFAVRPHNYLNSRMKDEFHPNPENHILPTKKPGGGSVMV